MNAGRKVPVVGSYAVLQSIARNPRASPPEKSDKEPRDPPPKEPRRKPLKHRPGIPLTHTVMPTRRWLACYRCDAEFELLGQHRFTVCPHCRERVDIVQYALDGDFDQAIQTAGEVHLKPGASVRGGQIKASGVRIEGLVESGRIRTLRLDIEGEGRIHDGADLAFRDLRIGAGADMAFSEPVRCRDVTVCGCLRAEVHASGSVQIEAGGCLRGSVEAGHLRVAEGGGLCAKVDVRPDREPADA